MIVSVENVTLSMLVPTTKVLKRFYKGVSVVETFLCMILNIMKIWIYFLYYDYFQY